MIKMMGYIIVLGAGCVFTQGVLILIGEDLGRVYTAIIFIALSIYMVISALKTLDMG